MGRNSSPENRELMMDSMMGGEPTPSSQVVLRIPLTQLVPSDPLDRPTIKEGQGGPQWTESTVDGANVGVSLLVGWLGAGLAGASPAVEGRVRLSSGEPVVGAQVRLFELDELPGH